VTHHKDAQAQEAGPYTAPPRFPAAFSSSLRRSVPRDEPGQLAWAVKNLELDTAKELLQRWPDGARLVDKDGNTLFHLAATETNRYTAQPEAAEGLMQLLLKHGWDVVDAKNHQGERADVVARKSGGGVAQKLLAARSHDWHEKLRMEDPLPLIGESSPTPEKWMYLLQDEQRRSWLGVLKGAVPEETCARWFNAHVEQGKWHQPKDIPRKTAWYVNPDCMDCPYRYGGLEYKAVPFPPFMLEIRDEVCRLCGIPPNEAPNCCNVNIYADQTHEVGWHSDDEVLFQGLAGDTRIISLSLGVPRDFCWRLQGTTDLIGRAPLGNGDVATMEGLFQKHYKHAVPVCSDARGARINMTFRWIVAKADAHDAHVATKK